jgi:hypothetical protein
MKSNVLLSVKADLRGQTEVFRYSTLKYQANIAARLLSSASFPLCPYGLPPDDILRTEQDRREQTPVIRALEKDRLVGSLSQVDRDLQMKL